MKKILEDDFDFKARKVNLSKANFIFNSTPKFAKGNISYPSNFIERINPNRGSSANIRKAKSNSQKHNERLEEKEPYYFLPNEYRQENETWNCGQSEKELYEQEIKKYNEAKTNYNGKRPSFENSCWEMIINLNNTHDMKDCQKVADLVANKFNFHSTRIAIHRDEGRLIDLDNSDDKTNTLILTGKRKNCYKDENSKKYYRDENLTDEIKNIGVIYNYHAHLNFLTIKDAKQNMRRAHINRKDLSNLQTELADLLNMPRGEILKESERSSDKKHKSGREYAKEQHETQEYLLNQKEQKAILEQERKASIGKDFSKEYFRELRALADTKPKSAAELKEEISELKKRHNKIYSSKEYIQELENKIFRQNEENQKLVNFINLTKENLETITEQEREKYRIENRILRKEVEEYTSAVERVNYEFSHFYADIEPLISRWERERPEREKRREQERMEKERAEKERAEQERIEQEKAKNEQIEKRRAELQKEAIEELKLTRMKETIQTPKKSEDRER